MSPKKSKRSQAAQQLIDDLLEELPASKPSSNSEPKALEVSMGDQTGSFGPVDHTDSHSLFEGDGANENSLHLESSPKLKLEPAQESPLAATSTRIVVDPKSVRSPELESEPTKRTRIEIEMPKDTRALVEAEAPTVPKLVPRTKIERPASDAIRKEEVARPEADIDFGAMSTEDDAYVPKTQPAKTQADDERTMRMSVENRTLVSPPEPRSEVIQMKIDRGGATEIRSGVKIPPSPKLTVADNSQPSSFEGVLKQSESLRIAQTRITDLERELERVRRDNEQLSTAGDTLRRRADELMGKAESFEMQAREAALRLDEEKKVLRGQIQAKDRDNSDMKARVEEIETRLESNFKKIRVRERELEHRLEIVKMESSTLVTTKDKMLLDLKRQIDQLHQESDSAKSKSQELFSQYKEKQETIRRVVRALRIALTILEGDDETIAPLKKAE